MRVIRKLLPLLIFAGIAYPSAAQTIPATRCVDWTLAGLRDTTTLGFVQIDMQTMGVVGDGITPNDSVLSVVLSTLGGSGGTLSFPAGNFLFNNTIVLPSNVVIKGQGSPGTTFTMSLGGSGYAIRVDGSFVAADTASFTQAASKDSSFIYISDTAGFSPGDWIQLFQVDTDYVTSVWAIGTVGQIVQIDTFLGNKLILKSPLRMSYPLARSPYIRRIVPAHNTGIECLKLVRTDDTAPEQSSSILFRYAANCWVSGIESYNCTFAHIEAEYSSNLSISKSYLHHAFDYGENGRAYGVILHFTTNECRVEDNIFEHLRHAMIVQAGANGNVYAYNYSFDPYWTTLPNNSSGDMVLHGNYVYANLFEQNIGRNIVIDDSHGPNGPYNTFFRNRPEGYGIFFSAANSPDQNLVGNDIPNTIFPYSLVNYTILGTGHFIYGNNNKGTINPAGTQLLPDLSYAYAVCPDFVAPAQWAAIGTPNVMGAASNPARDRYMTANIFGNSCGNLIVAKEEPDGLHNDLHLFPNPVTSHLTVASSSPIYAISVTNAQGQTVFHTNRVGNIIEIDASAWTVGIFLIRIDYLNGACVVRKMMKIKKGR